VVNPLEHPLWTALHGPQRAFGRRLGRVAGYVSEVGMFVAFAPDPDQRTWTDLARYAGPGGAVLVPGLPGTPPAGWQVNLVVPGLQLVATPRPTGPADRFTELSALSSADVPDMLDLVRRTRPGPFGTRTVELGRYLGVRHGGRLVAMAGERMRPPGHTEISAVCTDPEFRGRGLAARLVTALADGIRARGEIPFLHVAESNIGAIRVYERLGFQITRPVMFTFLTAPS
jgi:ribosomal protein S18 acetylase RimI-like enzyme